MLTTFRMLLSLRASTLANLLYYYLQKLPLVGRRIPNSFYANLGFKKGIAILAFLLSVALGFALRFGYAGLLLYLPVVALGDKLPEETQLDMLVHIFVVISFVVAAISSATILEPKREKYVAVKLMRLSPDRYMQAVLAYRYLTFLTSRHQKSSTY
jgi:uncharacterized membrane protein